MPVVLFRTLRNAGRMLLQLASSSKCCGHFIIRIDRAHYGTARSRSLKQQLAVGAARVRCIGMQRGGFCQSPIFGAHGPFGKGDLHHNFMSVTMVMVILIAFWLKLKSFATSVNMLGLGRHTARHFASRCLASTRRLETSSSPGWMA
jgi:hypothetical protein